MVKLFRNRSWGNMLSIFGVMFVGFLITMVVSFNPNMNNLMEKGISTFWIIMFILISFTLIPHFIRMNKNQRK